MNTQRSDGIILDGDGVSRRVLARVGAGGLAAALLTGGLSPARAQEGTPAPEGGMPPGMAVGPLTNMTVADMPPAPVTVSYYRLTIEPGAIGPASSFLFPSILFIESGVAVCPGDGPRFVTRAGGAMEEVGDEDVTLNPGDAIYVPANVLDGVENRGTVQVVAVGIDLMPGETMATPSA